MIRGFIEVTIAADKSRQLVNARKILIVNDDTDGTILMLDHVNAVPLIVTEPYDVVVALIRKAIG